MLELSKQVAVSLCCLLHLLHCMLALLCYELLLGMQLVTLCCQLYLSVLQCCQLMLHLPAKHPHHVVHH